MNGRLAFDFGTSNTCIAVWDEATNEGIPLNVGEFCRLAHQGEDEIPIIPSIIHYSEHGESWIGNQVIQRGYYHSRRTFRWMKRYIANRSPIRVNFEGREITPYHAGEDFLRSIMVSAALQSGNEDAEIALTLPVESFEHYENWLAGVAEKAGLPRCRFIDEPSAAALGYGAHILPGNVYLLFDFGGGTMHAAVILIEDKADQPYRRQCRVLGKAGKFIGGSTIDQWLYLELLRLVNKHDYDEPIRNLSNALLESCEIAKETLSSQEDAKISLLVDGENHEVPITRNQFELLLDKNGLFTEINRTIRSAIHQSRENGYDEDSIQSALMVGGSSAIPSVQRAVRQVFGAERVFSARPLDAVARGAAAFIAGVDFFDFIQHDYAIRYSNPISGEYEYRPIVKHGTPYPTQSPVTKLIVKCAYDGQTRLGIAIFEISRQQIEKQGQLEIFFDASGQVRLMPITHQEADDRRYFWLNENQPTFIDANPAGTQGQPRFEVIFMIDYNKRLTISTRDLLTDRILMENYPVVKLV